MQTEYATTGRWPDVFREMRRAQDEVNRIFGGLRFAVRTEFPPVNMWAGEDKVIVMAEMPGVSPDAVDVTVHQDTVTLRGKREPEAVGDDAVPLRQERPRGAFVRTMMLPFRVDADRAAARFVYGVLTLDLPRPASDQPRQIKVVRS
jgi:HSP20 family protein